MQLLPMASSPDGLISARDAVITNTPDGEVLTTTRNPGWGGGQRRVGGNNSQTTPATTSTTPNTPTTGRR